MILLRDIIGEMCRNEFEFFSPARPKIDGARLVTADHARRLRACAQERNRKACRPCEISTAGDRHGNRNARQAI
jgi:hypothetical protein